MTTAAKPAIKPTSIKSDAHSDLLLGEIGNGRQDFLVMALNMSWQLALVVLVPVLAGVQLDKTFGISYLLFVGLGLAVIGSGLVMWHSAKIANNLPVVQLTAAQKRAIQKQYEAEDNE